MKQKREMQNMAIGIKQADSVISRGFLLSKNTCLWTYIWSWPDKTDTVSRHVYLVHILYTGWPTTFDSVILEKMKWVGERKNFVLSHMWVNGEHFQSYFDIYRVHIKVIYFLWNTLNFIYF